MDRVSILKGTSMSIEAGRELDAMVAEKVMGLETGASGDNAWILGDALYVIDDGHAAVLPHYSTDIAAAWLVVEKMRADGWHFELSDRDAVDEQPFWVEFATKEYERGGQSWQAAAPHAICLAALKAVGALE
jgi:hypothetical protein